MRIRVKVKKKKTTQSPTNTDSPKGNDKELKVLIQYTGVNSIIIFIGILH